MLLLAAACAKPGDPGVVMNKLSADLAFGAESPRARAEQPLPSLPPVPSPVQTPDSGDDFGPIILPPTSCPDASPTAFPDQEAPIRISGEPAAGNYRWVFDGTQKVPNFPRPLPLVPFGTRSVTDVTRDALDRLAYTIREKDPAAGVDVYIASRFLADTDGLHLQGITWTGDMNGTFAPLVPVMYLPTPVEVGASFQSTGIDPASLLTLAHTGKVIGRQRVDACGALIEGWSVDAEQVFTRVGGTPERREYDYVVATHLGALLIFEHVETPCNASTEDGCEPVAELIYDGRIGTLKPVPIPE